MAKIHYEADGDIPAARFVAALTDFSERRTELWPNLDAKYYRLHELGDSWAEVTEGTDVLGGVWAREHYDWSEPGRVTLRLVEAVDFQRTASSLRGRFVGVAVALGGTRQFSSQLRETLARLAAMP